MNQQTPSSRQQQKATGVHCLAILDCESHPPQREREAASIAAEFSAALDCRRQQQ
jgi:hypothetical protein